MSDITKEFFIEKYYDSGLFTNLVNADNRIKKKFKKYVDELCKKNNIIALEIKGYCTYGEGNIIYECDWGTSKNCLLKVVESAADWKKAEAANALGYIYYYGRCNNGVPQYDEALKYFTMGMAYGLVESSYKLADMLVNGYGIPKNEEAALGILFKLYNNSYYDFAYRKIHGKFADIAFRLAKHYIELKEDYDMGYQYCLEAWYAIQQRENLNIYGDDKVSANIKALLDKVQNKLGNKIHEDVYDVHFGYMLDMMLVDNDEISLKIVDKNNSRYFVIEKSNNYNLLNIPFMSYCQHVNRIIVKSYMNTTDVKIKNGKNKCKVDYYESKTGKLRYRGRVVAKVMGRWVRFYGNDDPYQKMDRDENEERVFLKVNFKGKKYRCFFEGNESVAIGDIVWIMKGKSVKAAKVVNVFKDISEIKLSKGRFLTAFKSTG